MGELGDNYLLIGQIESLAINFNGLADKLKNKEISPEQAIYTLNALKMVIPSEAWLI